MSTDQTAASEVARVLPDPKGGCVCSFESEDRGGGYSELVQEYEPACPVHSEHLYDPRTGMWVLREEARSDAQATIDALNERCRILVDEGGRLRAAHQRDVENLGQANVRLAAQMDRLTEERAAECIGNAFERWATDPTVRDAARRVVAMVQAEPRDAQIATHVPAEQPAAPSGGVGTSEGAWGAPRATGGTISGPSYALNPTDAGRLAVIAMFAEREQRVRAVAQRFRDEGRTGIAGRVLGALDGVGAPAVTFTVHDPERADYDKPVNANEAIREALRKADGERKRGQK